MSTINLLYENQFAINEDIRIVIPTVGDVLKDEDKYYGKVSMLTAMPIDLMLELDEAGIDFSTLSEYELFIYYIFPSIKNENMDLIFDGLDLSYFDLAKNVDTGKIVLYDETHDIMINRAIQGQIAATLRRIHHIKKNTRKPANKEARDYLLERAKVKKNRKKSRTNFSNLESLIVSLVNSAEFKYDYESVKDLTIYQFNESLWQISHLRNYNNLMTGVYTGNVDPKGVPKDELTWLSNS